ncbi:hypothetical protein OTU49_010795 [Cherax quadricarinatus]|uniref:Uncharacterized protein n=1 Tax=Cherax quadricarinatus TaxID=27406 RepID=A0AAW0YJL0_CHEQU
MECHPLTVFILCGILWTFNPVSCLPSQSDHSITTVLQNSPPRDYHSIIAALLGSSPVGTSRITTTLPVSASENETDRSDSYSSGLEMDNQKVMQKVRQEKKCIFLNITENSLGLQMVKEVNDKSLTFFIRPKLSFKKLEFRLKLRSLLEIFETRETINIHNSDLVLSKLKPWIRIDVEYYRKSSMGPNLHALNVTVGNTSHSLQTQYRRFFYNYKSFVISAEGGAHVLFNCLPRDLQEIPPRVLSFSRVWLMAGLFITTATLLVVLFFIWLSLWCRKRSQISKTHLSSPVYEEFDEEVLKKIRQKVETLRSGKSQSDLRYSGVVSNKPGRENTYVTGVTLLQGSEKQKEENEIHVYQNVYAVRPTPAARLIKETSRVEAQYHNLTLLSNTCREVPDECSHADDSHEEVEETHENQASIFISPGEEVVDKRLTEETPSEAACCESEVSLAVI